MATLKKSKSLPTEKQVSNAASTGNAGGSFESRVQASRLLSMCLGNGSIGISDGRIVEIRFQARVHGYHTDDLVCTFQVDSDLSRKVLVQIKRTLNARPSDKAFVEAVTAAWLDYSNKSLFIKGSDSIFLVHDVMSLQAMSGASSICQTAVYSATLEEFTLKVQKQKFSNNMNRKALNIIRDIISDSLGSIVQEEILWDFLKHLTFLSQDLDRDYTAEHSGYLTNIQQALALNGELSRPHDVWSSLITACQSANATAATVTFDNLEKLIGSSLYKAFTFQREFQLRPYQVAPINLAVQESNIESKLADLTLKFESLSKSGIQAHSNDDLPSARDSSANKVISIQLDSVHSRVKNFKYADAYSDLNLLEGLLDNFDEHQKARWYLLCGTCQWHLGEIPEAAANFIQAADCFEDEDKFAAARVRGLLLQDNPKSAAEVAKIAIKRFPDSLPVWVAATNARMVLGETLSESDIPKQFEDKSDAWHMLAHSQRQQGDLTGALKSMKRTSVIEPSSFFAKETLLSFCVEKAAGDSITSVFRMLEEDDRIELQKCADSFLPREQHLWRIQCPLLVETVITNLAAAYILMSQPKEVIKLLDEARAHGIRSNQFIRYELNAIEETDGIPAALKFGSLLLEVMPKEALASYAHCASAINSVEIIEQCVGHAKSYFPPEEELVKRIIAMRWKVLSQVDMPLALSEIESVNWALVNSFPEILIASQTLRIANKKEDADRLLVQAQRLLDSDVDSADRYMLAQAFLYAKDYKRAAENYEHIAHLGTHSEIHADLLNAYIRSGRYSKAKDLVDSFPSNWQKHTFTRHLGMELARRCGDWQLLSELVDFELIDEPKNVRAWLYKAMCAARISTDFIHEAIALAPINLEGDTEDIARFASIELRHDFQKRAINRLYVMRRLRLDSTEAAASHLMPHLSVAKKIPFFDAEVLTFDVGASIKLVDDSGKVFIYTLDPPDLKGLPFTSEFIASDSPEAKLLIGSIVGKEISIKTEDDDSAKFLVESISTAYVRLLEISNNALRAPLVPAKSMRLMNFGTDENGDIDLSLMKNHLQKTHDQTSNILKLYESSPITLSILAERIGKDLFDTLQAWPVTGPMLDVNSGELNGFTDGQDLLARSKSHVLDASFLIELANLECLDVLVSYPQIYVVAHTIDIINSRLEKLKDDRESGTAFIRDGELGFIESSQEERLKEQKFVQSILDTIEKYCQVIPAYGNDELTDLFLKFEKVLTAEEHAVLLACMEKQACLNSLDARLRLVAASFNIPGMWPQGLLYFAFTQGFISHARYATACFKQLLFHRTFIRVTANEMLCMSWLGTKWLTSTFDIVKRQFSNPATNYTTAIQVTYEYFSMLVSVGSIQVGCALQLVTHLSEGLFLNPNFPEDMEENLAQNLIRILDIQKPIVRAAVRAGKNAARTKKSPSYHLDVLMCSSPPTIVVNKADGEDYLRELLMSANNTISTLEQANSTAILPSE